MDTEESTCGWVLHIIEGPIRSIIICVYLIIVFVAALIAILCTIIPGDMQGGMATGTLLAGFPLLIVEAFGIEQMG
jgi:uncharacterized RDD family membrane protein YckC